MSRRFILRKDELQHAAELTIDYRSELNDQQYEVATAGDGAMLVVAGAGTGKTRTLVYRVAYLVETGVAPESVVLLTFTRRSAREMLARASALLDGRCSRVNGGTFHSYCLSILRRHASVVGYESNFTILDSSDAADVVDIIRTAAGYGRGEKRFPRKRLLYDMFSRVTNRSLEMSDLLGTRYPQFVDYEPDIRRLHDEYRSYKRRHSLMDYDDLLGVTVQLLEENDDTRRRISGRCRHVLVDEYQDTNAIQCRLVELFSSEHHNVMVVGDDAQSIYRFRGADPTNIFRFPDQFEGARVLKLEHNYRSVQPILDLANHLLLQASKHYEKKLFSDRKDGEQPAIVPAPDDRTESRFVAQMILQLREDGVPLTDMAVLFRNGHNSYALEIELGRRNVPFVKYGGVKLSEAAHIKDVVAHLRILENPNDAVSWNRVLQLLDGIGPKTAHELISWITEARTDPFLLEEKPFSPRYAESLHVLFEVLRSNRVEGRTVLKQVESICSYYQPVMKRKYYEDYPKREVDLEHFVGLAERFADRASFLSSLALDPIELSALDVEPTDQDEGPLVLSTIHSAKGLEFNTVFIIQALEGVIPSSYALREQVDLDEELRLLYVAVTRAKNFLFISYPMLRYRRHEGEYLAAPSRYIRDVPAALLERWSLVEEDDVEIQTDGTPLLTN